MRARRCINKLENPKRIHKQFVERELGLQEVIVSGPFATKVYGDT